MRSTFACSKAVSDVLIDAQNSDIPNDPFVISAGTDILNYKPGDYRVDTVPPQDGIYIYFDESDFNKSNSGGNAFGTEPFLNMDIFASKPATKAGAGGAVTYSVVKANEAMQLYAGQIFDAIHHTEFLRLMNAKLTANATISDDVQCSKLTLLKASTIGVLNLIESSKSTAVFQFKLEVDTTEITGFNPGIPFTGTDDQITPYRREEDFPDD